MPTQAELVAIENYVFNTTVPVLYEHDGIVSPIATGTFLQINARSFLITAGHLFDKIEDPRNLGCPKKPTGKDVGTFGSIDIIRPDLAEIDVAILELRDAEFVSSVRLGWHFLTPNNVALPTPSGNFFLSGYPTTRVKFSGDEIRASLITAYSQRLHQVPVEAVKATPGVDLFFEYGVHAISISGKTIETPKLEGTSGASIWELYESSNGVWTPDQAVKVVAIQSAYIHRKYFRGISWAVIAQMFAKVDGEIGQEMFCALNRAISQTSRA